MNKSQNKAVMWKRASGHVLLALSLFFVLMCTVLGTDVYAEDESSGDFTYTSEFISAGSIGIVITGYTGKDKVVMVPETIGDLPVYSIGENAFADCTDIEEVILPNSVISLQQGAFAGCSSLKTINIPDAVEFIDSQVFMNCTALTEIYLSKSLKYISYGAFEGCSALEKIEFSYVYTPFISADVFRGCSKLTIYGYKNNDLSLKQYAQTYDIAYVEKDLPTFAYAINEDGTITIDKYSGHDDEVVIPDSIDGMTVVAIGDNAFGDNNVIVSVSMPSTITSIGANAFCRCKALSSVELSAELEEIGAEAFSFCESIEKIIIPEKVVRISEGAFEDCKELSHIELPGKLEYIGAYVFAGCLKLKSLSIPESVSYFSESVLYNSSIEYLELPSGYNEIRNLWDYGKSLKEVTFNGYIESVDVSSEIEADSVVINGYASSALYKFAQENGFTYNVLGELPYDKTKRVADKSGSLEVSKPTARQIEEMENSITSCDAKYVIEPSTTAPYVAGQLTDEYIDTGVTYLNYVRYIAGLPEVYADAELNESAQYGTTLLAIRGKGLSHTPEQPEGVPDDFYKKGYAGTSSSNLGSGYGSFYSFILGCMDDGGSFTNLTTAGHRRWLLSPGMKYVGFGKTRSYYATKVFDENADAFDYDFISWPASGNFPTDMISKYASWTVSLNPEKYMKPEPGKVKVKVTRHSDNKVWDMAVTDTPATQGELADTDCFVNNVGYGVSNCILFYLENNDCTGTYTVEITGLQDLYESEVSLKYDVNFYNEDEIDTAYNGFIYEENEDTWYCVADGKKCPDYTGLWYDETVGWWYVKDGRIDFTYNGFVLFADTWWCVAGGRVAFDYTGLWYDETVGWWYVENGAINFNASGLVYYADTWWCVAGGRVCFDYTGLWYDENVGWWYVENGIINFGFNGFVPFADAWWCVAGGRVCFDYTGLWCDANVGWWYVENGIINFGFNGAVDYNGGSYNVSGGAVVF